MRIAKVPDGISWKSFQEKYRKFFLISSEPRRIEAMGREYKRLTGREPKDEAPEKPKRQPSRRRAGASKEEDNSQA